jgi:Adaptor complexes medium subunit family
MTNQDDAFDPFGLQETIAEGTLDDFGQRRTSASFDPFHVNDEGDSDESPLAPPHVSRVSRSTKGVALPPKLNVKLTINEEVSSTAFASSEGASQVVVEGSIYAQVQCSDAMKNAPFHLVAQSLGHNEGVINICPNPKFVSSEGGEENLVKIPKHEIGFVPIARYSLTNEVQHMPLLLERKVTVTETSCRIAVQVRSKLSNRGNMEDFTIAVAVPECVNGESIEIVRGEGEYDELKRAILWKLPELEKGESFMVSAQVKLWEPATEIQFPVMLRCSSSADQISNVEFKVTAAEGYPSSITCNTTHSFRLLHRLS